MFCGQYFASEDLIGGQYLTSEDLEYSRARRAPEALLGAHHQSQHHWSGSSSRQQP